MKLKSLFQLSSLTAILLFAVISCSKEQAMPAADNSDNEANIEQIRQSVEATLTEIQASQENPTAETRSHCDGRVVVVRANSHNALKDAIHQAGEGGIVYLKSGVHTETEAITIRHRINIVGADGAVLKVKSALAPGNNSGAPTNPFFHILNARSTAFINVEMTTLDEDGATTLLFENAHNSVVSNCKISNFQYAILVEKSDRMCIVNNTLKGTSAWQTREEINAIGINIINGRYGRIVNNTVSNFFFGIWPCDDTGICERNYTYGSFLGIILCNVPKAIILPSGTVTGSLVPSKNWKVRKNNSTDNLAFGYLVIDGANNNLLENNNAARNGAYDIELAGDSQRFGFFTPKSFNNKVIAGSYQQLKIKDCGENNTVIGGVKVDTATDPCN